MSQTMMALSNDDPMMKAWNAWCKTDEFKNALHWTQRAYYDDDRQISAPRREDHAKGAMWLAFTKGMEVAQQPVEPPVVEARTVDPATADLRSDLTKYYGDNPFAVSDKIDSEDDCESVHDGHQDSDFEPATDATERPPDTGLWHKAASALWLEVVNLRAYASLLEHGMSAYEARESVWPQQPASNHSDVHERPSYEEILQRLLLAESVTFPAETAKELCDYALSLEKEVARLKSVPLEAEPERPPLQAIRDRWEVLSGDEQRGEIDAVVDYALDLEKKLRVRSATVKTFQEHIHQDHLTILDLRSQLADAQAALKELQAERDRIQDTLIDDLKRRKEPKP